MKKLLILLTISIFAVSTIIVVNAHPSNTDEYGCHYCRTNCEKWGLAYGEYHCHNGNGSNYSEYYYEFVKESCERLF